MTTAAVASVALVPGVGNASPQPTVSQVKAKVQQLNQQSEQADQNYDQASSQLATLQQQVNQLQSKIAQEQAALSSLEGSLGELAAAQYRSGGVDQTLQLMLSQHPDQFLQQTTTMAQVSSQQSDSLRLVQQQQRQLRQDQAQAAQEISEAQHARTVLNQQKSAAEQALRQEQSLLDTLDAQAQAEVEAALNGGGGDLPPGTLPAVSGRAGVAIAFAESQVGKAYVLGATGPNAWDCSGLMQAAWARAGVSLPRTTYSQIDAAPSVPPTLADLQPGDLIFYYPGVQHVAMYVGNGIIVQAANPSAGVDYGRWNSMPIVGAVRP